MMRVGVGRMHFKTTPKGLQSVSIFGVWPERHARQRSVVTTTARAKLARRKCLRPKRRRRPRRPPASPPASRSLVLRARLYRIVQHHQSRHPTGITGIKSHRRRRRIAAKTAKAPIDLRPLPSRQLLRPQNPQNSLRRGLHPLPPPSAAAAAILTLTWMWS